LGVERPTIDKTWLDATEVIARRRKCSRAQHAAVIVSKDGLIESSGYNGPPHGWPTGDGDCKTFCAYSANPERYTNGNYDDCPAVHAETNAIAHVDRTRINKGTLYVNGSCCMTCAKLVANSGVSRVVMKVKASQSYRNYQKTIDFLRDCGLEVTEVKTSE
jgi:dCMP deaminase